MFYSLIRPFIFALDPETAHDLTVKTLARAGFVAGFAGDNVPDCPVNVMGIRFKNPVGVAAGLDKNGECLDGLAALGFGFLEVGTVTPRAQAGRPKPRLFRLPAQQALINRMGFNNHGVDYLLEQVARSRYNGVLGINIGKNADTPIENAVDDYLIGLRKVYSVASYVTVNISSPNTEHLRQLQEGDELKVLLDALKHEQHLLTQAHGRYVPLVLKIAPDLNEAQIRAIARLLIEFGVDGVIATNTTLSRETIAQHPLAGESGGLSGLPLKALSTQVVKQLAGELAGKLPIIAVGGILSGDDAQEKFEAGASLVQIYTGLVYRGAALVKEIVQTRKAKQKSSV